MKQRDPRLGRILQHPLKFVWQTLRAFRANQGLLLAGAVAYYALLSIVPLLMLSVIGLSHFIDQHELLHTVERYLEWFAPGQSVPLVEELARFVEHRQVLGPVLFLTLLFFSSLAFSVLENAISVIFVHRVVIRRRHFLLSAVLPYLYILCLTIGLLLVTAVSIGVESISNDRLALFGHSWPLERISGLLLYLLGVACEILLLTSIYMVMPVGRLPMSHALIGGVTATLLWEIARHLLVWYFETRSRLSQVYGSLTTAIVILFTLEMAAILLLYGAQVISEFERIGTEPIESTPQPAHTPLT